MLYVMKGLRRNHAEFDRDGNALLDSSGQPTEAELVLHLDFNTLEAVTDHDLSIPKRDAVAKESGRNNDVTTPLSYADPNKNQRNLYQYIRFGFVQAKYADPRYEGPYGKQFIKQRGQNVYTFYRGAYASPSLPNVSDLVTYQGEWDFLSDVKKNKGKTLRNGDDTAYNNFNEYGDGDFASATKINNEATETSYSSLFKVDFANKKLTGKLSYRSKTEPERTLYTLEANLNGNRFTGQAKSAVNEHSSIEDKAFFSADSSLLEGGFYGPKGEELAGKFLANDNSLFGVFGGKRNNQDPEREKQTRTLFDAVYIAQAQRSEVELDEEEPATEETETGHDQADVGNTGHQPDDDHADDDHADDDHADDDHADDENGGEDEGETEPTLRERLDTVAPKPLTNFGFAGILRFGGHTFKQLDEADWSAGSRTATLVVSKNDDGSLKEAVHLCCSNLSYLRFGSLTLAEKTGETPIKALFLQGDRTDIAQMPQSGKVKYAGTWSGFIQTASPEHNNYARQDFGQSADMSTLSSGRAANRAEFDVNFADKTLTGELTAANGLTAFNIDAHIDGSGFTGTAATPRYGFAFDPGNQVGGRKVEISGAEVKGGFYGPDAKELGGFLHYNSDEDGSQGLGVRAGAVFGAVRQD